MIGDLIARLASAFRRVLLPLAAYYAVTVAIPLANGAAQSGATFWQHTLAVLIVPPLIVVLVCSGVWLTAVGENPWWLRIRLAPRLPRNIGRVMLSAGKRRRTR